MIRRLAPILGITFIDILGFSLLIPLLPYYVMHFKQPAIVVGGLFSLFSFCQLVTGPLWGNLSDRIGRKGVLMISQVGSTIGWAMLGWAPSILWVFLARFLEGCSGGNIGVTQAYVADLVEPKERARAFGYIGATFAGANGVWAGHRCGPGDLRILRSALHGGRAAIHHAARHVFRAARIARESRGSPQRWA